MGTGWGYSKMSHDACETGGPDAYKESLVESGRRAGYEGGRKIGHKEGQESTYPLIVFLAGVSLFTIKRLAIWLYAKAKQKIISSRNNNAKIKSKLVEGGIADNHQVVTIDSDAEYSLDEGNQVESKDSNEEYNT